MARTVKCGKHMDCFANRGGRCMSLKDNDFGGRCCPFYKSSAETDMDRVNMACEAYAAAHTSDRKAERDWS